MSERYTKLFALPENQYAVGAPVLIAAGALLKDNQTGKVLAQFKFKSISPKEIKAVKISVTAFDVSGKEVNGVAEYQYLDLSAYRDAEFGQKQAVPLPDAVTRTIGVECTGVVFEDGSVWEAPKTAQWKPLPKQTDLARQLKDVPLVSQYRRDTTESARFAVLDYEDLWLCACSSVNQSGETKCHSCQQNKAALTAALDTETLKKHKAAYEQVEAEKSAKQAAAKKAQKAKTRKIGMIAAAAAIVVIAAIVLVTKVVLPAQNYNKAVALMGSGSYDEAIAAFEAMGDYKDAAAKSEECATLKEQAELEAAYQEAVTLMESGSYDEAIAAFEAMGDYKDAAAKSKECVTLKEQAELEAAYQEAVTLMESGETGRAAIAFGKLGDYRDAKERSFELWNTVAVRDTVSAGVFHTGGLKSNGIVVAIGENEDGECDVSSWTDIIAISAWSPTMGLKSDGTVVAVGPNPVGQCDISDWTDIVAISAGSNHTVGLKSDGTVVAAGYNGDNQCNVSDWTDIVAISACWPFTIGLKSDGTVVAVGGNSSGQCNVSGWTDIVAISAGGYHTVGLKSDGTVVAVGGNSSGQCNVSGWTDIVAISAGDCHTVGLKSDGTVVAIGDNKYGECDVSEWKDLKLPE